MSKKGPVEVLLEGWLSKRKQESSRFFKSNNQRWFKLQQVAATPSSCGVGASELALCYYSHHREADAKGWIFMKDITDVIDDRKTFTVISPARTMVLEATTAAEHKQWVTELRRWAPQLQKEESGAKGTPSDHAMAKSSDGDNGEFLSLNPDSLKRLEAQVDEKVKRQSIDRSTSLFSRHAQGEKNSFYHGGSPAGGSVTGAANNSGHKVDSADEIYGEITDLRPELTRSQDLNSETAYALENIHQDDRTPVPPSSSSTASSQSTNPVSRRKLASSGEEDHRKAYVSGGSTTAERLARHIAGNDRDRGQSRERDSAAASGSSSLANSNSINEEMEDVRMVSNRARERRMQHEAEGGAGEDGGLEGSSGSGRGGSGSGRERRESYSAWARTSQQSIDEPQAVAEPEEKESATTASGDSTPYSREDKSVSEVETLSTAASSKPRRAPPPKMAPPRRARDALTAVEDSAAASPGAPRSSLEDFMRHRNSRPSSGTDREEGKSEGKTRDDDDDDIDFKAEYQQRLSATESFDAQSLGKPPRPKHRPPPGQPVPFTAQPQASSGANGNKERSGTPPRPQGQPGLTADRDFATDDWDAGDDDRDAVADERSNGRKAAESKAAPANATLMAADPNWLDEDFDA